MPFGKPTFDGGDLSGQARAIVDQFIVLHLLRERVQPATSRQTGDFAENDGSRAKPSEFELRRANPHVRLMDQLTAAACVATRHKC